MLAGYKVLQAWASIGEQEIYGQPLPLRNVQSRETDKYDTNQYMRMHMYTHSMIFQKCWYVSVRMKDLTLNRGVRSQVRKTFLSSRVENGRLRTWVTEMLNLTVSLLII